MNKDVNSPYDYGAGALEREAMTAKAYLEQLVHSLASLPADARVAIRAQIETERSRLEAIAAQAERALEDQRVELAAHLGLLEQQLQEQVDELERRRIEAAKAEAEAAYEDSRSALENARLYAKGAIELEIESVHVSESSLSS